MIKSWHFWVGIVLIAIIPLLLVDIAENVLSWHKEVRDQRIYVTENAGHFSKAAQTEMLKSATERGSELTFQIIIKSALCFVFLISGVYQLSIYIKKNKFALFVPALIGIVMVIVFLLAKYLWVVEVNNAQDVNFLKTDTSETSFQNIISGNFKGKVVYVDFWGTNCGPCLTEFQNFTHPLKAKYKSNPKIAFLYIATGNRYLWKRQIEKYKISGAHLYLDTKAYKALYHNAVGNDTAIVTMPRYVIVDKSGKTAINNAELPDNQNLLFVQLDKYLDGN